MLSRQGCIEFLRLAADPDCSLRSSFEEDVFDDSGSERECRLKFRVLEHAELTGAESQV